MNAETIRRVAVLGLGTMGHSIAQSFAARGLAVRCFDEAPEARETLRKRVRANLEQCLEVGLIDADAVEPTLDRLEVCDSEHDALREAEFVVEAVREDLATKQELFARAERSMSDACILASNTSTFPMTRIAANMRRPQRAIDTHWFNPPHICPLVEVVPGEETDEETVRTTIALHERIGKMAVRVNQELPGFLVNRIQVAMMREVLDLLERGVASAEDIDRAVRGSMGLRLAALGPLAVWDYTGLEVALTVYSHLVRDIRSDRTPPAVLEQIVDEGRFGFKTGSGFFEHPPENKAEELARRDRLYLELAKLLRQSKG